MGIWGRKKALPKLQGSGQMSGSELIEIKFLKGYQEIKGALLVKFLNLESLFFKFNLISPL